MNPETYEIENWSRRITRLQRAMLNANHMGPADAKELTVALEELVHAVSDLRFENDKLRRATDELAGHNPFIDRFMLAPEAFVETDRGGIVRIANRAAEKLLGIANDRLDDTPLVLFVGEAARSEFMVQLGLIEPGGEIRDWRLTMRPRNDSPAPMSVTVARPDDDEVLRWIIRDTRAADRRVETLVAERDDLAQRLESMPQGLIAVDGDWRITYANEAAEQMIGQTRDDLLGAQIWETFPAMESTDLADIGPRVMGQRAAERFQVEWGNGTWIEGAVYPVGDGLQAIFQDVTERKAVELRRERIEREQAQFISRAAHELRSPLTAITGFVHTLARRRHQMTEAEQDDSFAWLRHASDRMDQLIGDLLDLSQLGSAPSMHPGRVELDATVDMAMQMAPPPAGVSIATDVAALPVIADSMWLEQVVVNLVRNAYKYGGGHIEIGARNAGPVTYLHVQDDGDGVPAAFVPDLFEPFTRGESSTGNPGAGLGLAIVKRAVESFGATISYEAAEPHGARFTIRLRSAAA